ncbi:MAG: ABC transporter ATP-binding protein [Acidimicrobiia bacterium]|nr:ABC transporter ATP-binding protein [Acidimicrobiia bacterium]
MTAEIVIRNLSVRLGGTCVIDDLDLTVTGGHLSVLIGPNGAGKTTLLRAVLGLVPYEGEIELPGLSPAGGGRRELARLVAFVAQRPVIPEGMAVFDYVLLGRTPYIGYLGRERAADLEVTAEALELLDLGRFADRHLGSLSGGQLQRAVLARALAQEPSVLLLDEPTSALDIGQAQRVLELVDRIRRERGLTVLAAMHDLSLAGQFADALVLLNEGRTVAVGPPEAVLTADVIGEYYGATVHVFHDPDLGVVVAPAKTRRRPER